MSNQTPFSRIGGEAKVRALVERFYDAMDRLEPELAALHPLENGKVSRASRDRFALFLIGWLGGPEDYVQLHGHPRLRMRHGHVTVNSAMRDAWLRCMRQALDEEAVEPALRAFLDEKFSELANFLRNQGD
jgi:hemoglobin